MCKGSDDYKGMTNVDGLLGSRTMITVIELHERMGKRKVTKERRIKFYRNIGLMEWLKQ